MSKEKKQPSVLLRLIKEMKMIKWWIALVSAISLVGVALELAGPMLLGDVIDVIYDFWKDAVPMDTELVIRDCLFLAGIYLFQGGTSYARMYILNNAVSKYFTCALRIKISDKITRMPVSFVDKTPNGELISRMMNDVSRLGNSVHSFIDIIITGFIKLLAIAVIVLCINPLMAIPVIAFIPLSILLSSYIAKKTSKHFRSMRELDGKIYTITDEDYSGFETVRAFNLSDRQNKEHADAVDARSSHMQSTFFISGLAQPAINVLNNIAYIAICAIGGYLAVMGEVPVGEVVTFILYAKLFATPLETIAEGFSHLQGIMASARRVYELLDGEEMESDIEAEPANGPGEVVFEHVYFSYKEDTPLIEDLNLRVKPGQKVAIVGPTGGGKTTIVNLIMRFYDINSGSIKIDGVDTMKMDRSKLRSLFGMVLQDTWLFSGTIYENIAYGCPGATKEAVEEAARKAHLDYYISTLPDGYNTMINEESTNISGGQKQLITIARAYLSNRKMLILDEATSNVDTRTELLIQQTMDELMSNRTSFVIAHRLSTIVDADIIIVINNGKIVEQGSHSELMAKNGFYREIYDSQYALIDASQQ